MPHSESSAPRLLTDASTKMLLKNNQSVGTCSQYYAKSHWDSYQCVTNRVLFVGVCNKSFNQPEEKTDRHPNF